MKVDWLVINTITRARRRSLVHIVGWYNKTLCGCPIPIACWNADNQPDELTCFRCVASHRKLERYHLDDTLPHIPQQPRLVPRISPEELAALDRETQADEAGRQTAS